MNIFDYLGIPTAHAVDSLVPIKGFVGKVNRLLVNPLIVLMFAAALAYFLYGVVEFLMNADQSEARETGRQHMLWGIIGMFIMIGVFAILHFIETTLGVPANPNIPSA